MTSWMKTPEQEAARRARHGQRPVVVVIPYYNGSDFIERSARSVLEQTVAPAEFLVVDDGSNPKEAAKLEEISRRMGFQILRKENGGQGSARNFGVQHSSAPFICFLDQDDFYLKNHIELLIDALPDDDPHFGWVYGELFEADRDGNIVQTNIVSRHSMHPKTSIVHLIGHDMHVLPSASLISREAFEDVGGFDEQFMGYEDDDLFMRIFRRGYTNHFIEKPVTIWCIHTESTSHGIRMARSRMRYLKKLMAAFPEGSEDGRFSARDLLINRFNTLILGEGLKAAQGAPGKYSSHREEYIEIAQDYLSILNASPSLSKSHKRRIAFHSFILSHPKFSFLYEISNFSRQTRRQIRRILRY
ncbi:glycosyltransferase family 2 protein [Aureimonas sp. AU40]|uniref:glycosyltransferase family 2 protein n=1 Tax=Aureimonas sp. AU40 TaxID=1637747 RepID=UPI0009EB9C6C|nr:glycosyltransferase family A protein [Aureimonas sp. AU40]